LNALQKFPLQNFKIREPLFSHFDHHHPRQPTTPTSCRVDTPRQDGYRIDSPERACFPEAAAQYVPPAFSIRNWIVRDGGRITDVCRDAVFLNSKTKVKSARPGKNGKRWYKDVGLGFKTPIAAIEGSYIGTFDEYTPAGITEPDHTRYTIAHLDWEGKQQGKNELLTELDIQTRSAPSPALSPSVAVS
jgi:hypothetical protein